MFIVVASFAAPTLNPVAAGCVAALDVPNAGVPASAFPNKLVEVPKAVLDAVAILILSTVRLLTSTPCNYVLYKKILNTRSLH